MTFNTLLAKEKKMHPFIDAVYAKQGLSINRSADNRKYDLLIDAKRVEEKILFCQPLPKMLVEIMQDVESGSLGWYQSETFDYLHWFYVGSREAQSPVSYYRIDWKLCKPYLKSLMEARAWNKCWFEPQGYGVTVNYPVPWKLLIDNGMAVWYQLKEATFDNPFGDVTPI